VIRPLVSILTPAYRAQAFIGEALASVLAGDFGDFELILASDDGSDYRHLLPVDPRLVFVPPGSCGSGPAAARNRALGLAQGDYVCLLDADDLWSANYLAALLAKAAATGLAFAETVVTDWRGRPVRQLFGQRCAVDLAACTGAYGPLRGLVARRLCATFRDVFAEDVLWHLQALCRAGGRAPYVGAARYLCRQRPGSLCNAGLGFAAIDRGYAAASRATDASGLGSAFAHRLRALFADWRQVNRAFARSAGRRRQANYHEFVLRASATRWHLR